MSLHGGMDQTDRDYTIQVRERLLLCCRLSAFPASSLPACQFAGVPCLFAALLGSSSCVVVRRLATNFPPSHLQTLFRVRKLLQRSTSNSFACRVSFALSRISRTSCARSWWRRRWWREAWTSRCDTLPTSASIMGSFWVASPFTGCVSHCLLLSFLVSFDSCAMPRRIPHATSRFHKVINSHCPCRLFLFFHLLSTQDLVLVINYEVPHDYEDYVHRVG
jgi:hypothetical protein